MKLIEKMEKSYSRKYYIVKLSKDELKFIDLCLNTLHKNVYRFFPKTSDKEYSALVRIKSRTRAMREDIKEIFERKQDEPENTI